MIITIDVKDNVAQKLLDMLESFKNDVKISYDKSKFMLDMQKSQEDLEQNNIIAIDNVDEYIAKLQDEIK